MDWKQVGLDTPSVVFRNWLLKVHGPNYTADYLEEADTDDASRHHRENYPEYMTRNDQPNDPKGHYRY